LTGRRSVDLAALDEGALCSTEASPSALGIPRALGFSDPGPRGASRRTPRKSSPALARHLSGSLHRSSSHSGGEADPASSAELLASVHGPSAYPDQRTPLCARLVTGRSNGLALPSEGPASRVWLPSWRCQPFHPRELVSAPNAHGLRSSGRSSDTVADPRFPEDLPLLRFPVKPNGLTAALQRLRLTEPAAPTGSPTLFRWKWGPCPLELPHLPGLHPPDLRRGSFPPRAPPALFFPASEETENRSPRGSLPAARRFPSFEGR
jgi:hypothetical protein